MYTSSGLLQQPIFLVGSERSGTTLLRLMLDHHPNICWCSEFEYSVELISPDGKLPTLEEYYEWLETSRIFQATGFKINRNLSYPQLVDDFMRQQQASPNQSVIGATVHHHFDRLLHVWPDAKFIKILRDGRDVARSCIGMKWAGNLWRGADRWIEAEHLWADLARSLPQERYIVFKYEDLITDPAAVLGRICEFMGTDYNPAMLTYPQNTTYSTPDPKLVSQWKKKLSDKEIQLVEARIGNMLAERGYELSGLPGIEVSSLQVLSLHLHNYLMRTWGRLQDHGLPVIAMDFVSRRLGLKTLNRYATLQIHRTLEAQLK